MDSASIRAEWNRGAEGRVSAAGRGLSHPGQNVMSEKARLRRLRMLRFGRTASSV